MANTVSKKASLLERIKKLVFDSETPAVYTLADGTEVQITKLEVGGMVTIADAPAPAGTHVLQDGSSVTVDEAGIITVITPAATEPDGAQLESHTLADGSTLDVTSLEVGAAVTIGGNIAPAGTYTLEDGRSIVVDEAGNISEIKEKAAAQAMHKFEDLDTPDKIRAAMEKFGDGTPEEQIANLGTMVKALMEYCFGWQLREAQTKATTDAAIAVYQQKLSASEASAAKQKEINVQILELVEELAKVPSADPPAQKTVSTFSKVEPKNKALSKYAEAAKIISEEQKNN